MFKHLLVPLDGSRLAEAALPAAAYLARTLGASVTLIHVIERNAPQTVHGERHLTDAAAAQKYIDEVAARAFPPEVRVEGHVHTSEVSEVARSIVEHAGEFAPDLIVMCTHGGGGLKKFLVGSIAQQVVAQGHTSVLLITPTEEDEAPELNIRRLLIPLDGDPAHEMGIAVATDLAKACAADLYLLTVVPTLDTLSGERAAAGRLLPGTTSALLQIREEEAEASLRQHMARLQAGGLAVAAEVTRGDPAKCIVRTAGEASADVIVLGTHGKAGMDAFWQGSVAPKVAGQSRVPVLLVRLREQE
jgi:nucleotide-binding universal stress UspA family protein